MIRVFVFVFCLFLLFWVKFVFLKKNLNSSKPFEHPPNTVQNVYLVAVGTLAVGTKTRHDIKGVQHPQC